MKRGINLQQKELYQYLHALGVPINVYKWSFGEIEDSKIAKRLSPFLEDIESFLNSKKSIILYCDNYLLGSRLAATFLKAAIAEQYTYCRYTLPVNLVGYKIESWDNGDAYDDLLEADLLVIDKISSPSSDKFPQKVFEEFVEDRLLKDRCTIFVLAENPQFIFSDKILGIMSSLEVVIHSEGGKSFVTQRT
jgi:hypothetical protein